LAEGGYALMENGIPENALGLANPFHELWHGFNTLADAYGWRPLFSEFDWEETLAQIRRTVFPEEAQRIYGEGCWYGDFGRLHPSRGESNVSIGPAALPAIGEVGVRNSS